jgi:hypothetical protein
MEHGKQVTTVTTKQKKAVKTQPVSVIHQELVHKNKTQLMKCVPAAQAV